MLKDNLSETATSPLINQRKIRGLKIPKYYARKIDVGKKEQLLKSIEVHGWSQPIVVNMHPKRKNIIIDGIARYRLAKEQKWKEVLVYEVAIKGVETEKALALRLNQIKGEWDFDVLKTFDIELLLDTGFDETDLSQIWNDVLGTTDDQADIASMIAEAKKNPLTKVGDLVTLGKHKLLCGDAQNAKHIQRLIGEASIDMVYCDPPYDIGLNYNTGVSGQKQYGGKERDSRSNEEFEQLLYSSLRNALSHTKNDAHIFYWCDQKHIGTLQRMYAEQKVSNKRVCLWVKNNFSLTPKVAFHKAYEACVYGTIGNPYLADGVNLNEILNKEIEMGNRGLEDIIDTFDIWLCKRLPSNEYQHPTQKPISLHEKPLKRCTKIHDTVLDLFGGSGSTLLACEQMQRRAFLMEQDPVFCDVIVRRWEAMTGEKVHRSSPADPTISLLRPSQS